MSKINHILSVIHYTICGAVCFQFTHFSCDDWENIYTLSYYHHQMGSMNYYPLSRVISWNNGVRCMSFYILINIVAATIWLYHISICYNMMTLCIPQYLCIYIYVYIIWLTTWYDWLLQVRLQNDSFTTRNIGKWLIKSPQYTGGDFMFLYRFVRRCRRRCRHRRLRRRPQILVHAITFEQLFGFLSFLAQLLALTCRLPA